MTPEAHFVYALTVMNAATLAGLPAPFVPPDIVAPMNPWEYALRFAHLPAEANQVRIHITPTPDFPGMVSVRIIARTGGESSDEWFIRRIEWEKCVYTQVPPPVFQMSRNAELKALLHSLIVNVGRPAIEYQIAETYGPRKLVRMLAHSVKMRIKARYARGDK